MAKARQRLSAQLIFGCVIITLGVLFTLDNLRILQSGPILGWWPIVLVLFGASRMLGFGTGQQRVSGAVMAGIGTLLLLSNLHVIHFSIWDLWPLGLVAGGASLVARGMQRRPVEGGSPSDSDDRIHAFVIMGGVVRKMNSSHFVGGEATAFMGGVELDLRGAHPATDTVILDALVWWGGIELKVPPEWKVTSEVVPIMAGIEDKSKVQVDAKTHLVVRGLVVMGGIEVGN
jgi:cell wall-active antibiotic response 4TMS protein YvqF